MIYAIIETGGTQLRVEPGRFYDVNRIAAEPDAELTLERVLFVQNDGNITVGQPIVAGATVQATVLRHMRGEKIIVYKMRPKKKTRKKQGHRQELTRVLVNSISLNGEVLGSREAAPPTPAAATVEATPVETVPAEAIAADTAEE